MHRIFLPIYRFFCKHKPLMYILLVATSLIFIYFGIKVKYEEDISRLLPTSSVESELAFGSIGLKDKVFIQVTSAGEPLDAATLAERTDAFIDLLQQKDSSGRFINNILWKMEGETALNALDFVLGHIPSFIDTTAYSSFAAATEPATIKEMVAKDAELVMSDETGDITQAIGNDPLNLREAVLGDLLTEATGGYNIIEGHFFCPDSTVTISYLAPAFKTLDSGTATAFCKMMRATVKEFEQANPDTKVLFHGEPVGSVSNASRIKGDLVVTVGISLVMILILLGLCFRSKSFFIKILGPIIYGTAFALACIWWIKGSMSLLALGFGAIVLGVAISYCLHLLIHLFYVGDVEQLLIEESTPVFLGALTTIGAFLSLLFTDSDLLRDFGMFASLALAGSTLFALIFLPHFLKDKKGNSDAATFKTIERFNSIPFDRQHWLLWILTIVIAIGLVFSPKVKFDSDLRNLDYNGADELESETLFNAKNNDGYFHQYFATVSTDVDEALEANLSLAGILDSLKAAGDVHDFSDMVSKVFITEKMQQSRIDAWNAFWTPAKKQDVMDRLYAEAGRIGLYPDLFDGFSTILDTEYEPASLLESGVVPENLLSNFVERNADGQFMVFTDVSMSAGDKDIVTAALVKNPRTFILDPFYYCKDMVQVIHDDFNIAVWISALLVLLILIFSYRNIITALLSFLPMVISWFVVQGYMAIIGLKFNLINIVISTFIFGVGVDYSIFITEGLLARARTGSDEMLGYHKSAIFFSAIILLIVTCSLLFAQHPSIRSIGLSTLIGMACTILFSYAIQPFLFRQLMKIPSYKRSVLKKKPYVADNK